MTMNKFDFLLGIVGALALTCAGTFGFYGFIEMSNLGRILLFIMSMIAGVMCISLLIWRNRYISE